MTGAKYNRPSPKVKSNLSSPMKCVADPPKKRGRPPRSSQGHNASCSNLTIGAQTKPGKKRGRPRKKFGEQIDSCSTSKTVEQVNKNHQLNREKQDNLLIKRGPYVLLRKLEDGLDIRAADINQERKIVKTKGQKRKNGNENVTQDPLQDVIPNKRRRSNQVNSDVIDLVQYIDCADDDDEKLQANLQPQEPRGGCNDRLSYYVIEDDETTDITDDPLTKEGLVKEFEPPVEKKCELPLVKKDEVPLEEKFELKEEEETIVDLPTNIENSASTEESNCWPQITSVTGSCREERGCLETDLRSIEINPTYPGRPESEIVSVNQERHEERLAPDVIQHNLLVLEIPSTQILIINSGQHGISNPQIMCADQERHEGSLVPDYNQHGLPEADIIDMQSVVSDGGDYDNTEPEVFESNSTDLSNDCFILPEPASSEDLAQMLQPQSGNEASLTNSNSKDDLNNQLMVLKTPPEKTVKSLADYTSCRTCHGFFSKTSYDKHVCKETQKFENKSLFERESDVVSEVSSNEGIPVEILSDEENDVHDVAPNNNSNINIEEATRERTLFLIKSSEMGKIALSDPLIKSVCFNFLEKHPSAKDRQYVITKFRDAARLLTGVKNKDSTITKMRDCFHPTKEKVVLSIMQEMAGFDENTGKVNLIGMKSRLKWVIDECSGKMIDDIKVDPSLPDEEKFAMIENVSTFVFTVIKEWRYIYSKVKEKKKSTSYDTIGASPTSSADISALKEAAATETDARGEFVLTLQSADEIEESGDPVVEAVAAFGLHGSDEDRLEACQGILDGIRLFRKMQKKDSTTLRISDCFSISKLYLVLDTIKEMSESYNHTRCRGLFLKSLSWFFNAAGAEVIKEVERKSQNNEEKDVKTRDINIFLEVIKNNWKNVSLLTEDNHVSKNKTTGHNENLKCKCISITHSLQNLISTHLPKKPNLNDRDGVGCDFSLLSADRGQERLPSIQKQEKAKNSVNVPRKDSKFHNNKPFKPQRKYCLMCKTFVTNLPIHLRRNHRKKYNALINNKTRKEKLETFDKLRLKWNSVYDRKVINHSKLRLKMYHRLPIKSRLPNKRHLQKACSILCVLCGSIFCKRRFLRHKCSNDLNSGNDQDSIGGRANTNQFFGIKINANKEDSLIIDGITHMLQNELATQVAFSDDLLMAVICNHQRRYQKNKNEAFQRYTFKKIKLGCNFLTKLKEKDCSIHKLIDCLSPLKTEIVSQTIKELCKFEEETGKISVSSMPFRLAVLVRDISAYAFMDVIDTQPCDYDRKAVLVQGVKEILIFLQKMILLSKSKKETEAPLEGSKTNVTPDKVSLIDKGEYTLLEETYKSNFKTNPEYVPQNTSLVDSESNVLGKDFSRSTRDESSVMTNQEELTSQNVDTFENAECGMVLTQSEHLNENQNVKFDESSNEKDCDVAITEELPDLSSNKINSVEPVQQNTSLADSESNMVENDQIENLGDVSSLQEKQTSQTVGTSEKVLNLEFSLTKLQHLNQEQNFKFDKTLKEKMSDVAIESENKNAVSKYNSLDIKNYVSQEILADMKSNRKGWWKKYASPLCQPPPICTLPQASEKLKELVLPRISVDDFVKLALNDTLLVATASSVVERLHDQYLKDLGKIKQNNTWLLRTSNLLRYGGRFLKCAQSLDSTITEFRDLLRPSKVDCVFEVAKELCGIDEKTGRVKFQTKPFIMTYLINQTVDQLVNEALADPSLSESDKESIKKDMDSFLELKRLKFRNIITRWPASKKPRYDTSSDFNDQMESSEDSNSEESNQEDSCDEDDGALNPKSKLDNKEQQSCKKPNTSRKSDISSRESGSFIQRKRWTEKQKRIVILEFKDFIRKGTNPGRPLCRELIACSEELAGRTPDQVNLMIDNINKGKLKLPSEFAHLKSH